MRTMRILASLVGAVVSSSALAATDPQAIDLGGVQIVPTLGLSHTIDDNIFSQPTNQVDDWITRLNPGIQVVSQDDRRVFAVTYSGDYGIYDENDGDNYRDHTLSVDLGWDAGSRSEIELAASIARLHDARGEGSSEGAIALTRPEPDLYNAREFYGSWTFGAEDARFGFALEGGTTNIDYQNNRLETQFRDRKDTNFAGRVYMRVAPKTRGFIEYAESDIVYDILPLLGDTLDSGEQAVSVGMDWEITGRTTGSAKLGRTEKEFKANSRPDDDLLSWEAALTWAPRTYSVFTFGTSRQPQETNGTGTYIESENYNASWRHDWSSMVHSSASIRFGNETYRNDPRQDDRLMYSVGMDFDLDRWVNVGFSYSYQERDSNNDTFDYDRNVVLFSVDVSL